MSPTPDELEEVFREIYKEPMTITTPGELVAYLIPAIQLIRDATPIGTRIAITTGVYEPGVERVVLNFRRPSRWWKRIAAAIARFFSKLSDEPIEGGPR